MSDDDEERGAGAKAGARNTKIILKKRLKTCALRKGVYAFTHFERGEKVFELR